MFQSKAKLVYNKRVKEHIFCAAMQAAGIAKLALPGQFLEVKVSDSEQPLLRRPFSIHRIRGASLEVLYEVLGPGTELLAQKKAGDYLDLIGPLGNGFSVLGSRFSVLVAGGMGIAPLFFLAEVLAKRKPKTQNSKPLVLIGAKTKEQLLCEKEFKNLGYDLRIATDDGSKGFRGKVTELLEKTLLRTQYSVLCTTIYACGPRPMLQEISRISKQHKIPAQISLEEHMACGFGACLGCVIKTNSGFQRVCKEGPVFSADQIIWQ